jgi:hypothetical protein
MGAGAGVKVKYLRHASREIADFIDHDNKERPHWSLGFKTPEEDYNQLAA